MRLFVLRTATLAVALSGLAALVVGFVYWPKGAMSAVAAGVLFTIALIFGALAANERAEREIRSRRPRGRR